MNVVCFPLACATERLRIFSARQEKNYYHNVVACSSKIILCPVRAELPLPV